MSVMESFVRRKDFFHSLLLLGIAVCLFLGAGILNLKTPRPIIDLSMQEKAVNVNKDLLVFLSAGNRRLITDLLWVQTLIEGDLEHYSGRDLNSWMYIRFSTISQLDPYFYENYAWGGQYLSIVKDDLIGATELLKRGLRYYPDDYRIAYNLAFTYYFELGDYENGLKYMERIQFHPKAPQYFPSIVLKLKAELGYSQEALLALIFDRMTATDDKHIREKLTAEYHALKAERDIVCLTQKKTGCQTIDAYGEPYVYIFGKWHTRTPFIPYRLKRKGDLKMTKTVTTIED